MIIGQLTSDNSIKIAGEITENDRQPSFTRNSAAYTTDGIQVAVNTPRLEAGKFEDALLVEEGTTNLIINGSVEEALQYWWISNHSSSEDNGVLTRITNDGVVGDCCVEYSITLHPSWGYFSQAYYTYRTAPYFDTTKQYTLSLWAKRISGATSIKIQISDGSSQNMVWTGVNIPLQDTWTKYTFTFTPAIAGNIPVVWFGYPNGITGTLRIDGLQLEQKPYATSFIDGTRSAETLTIPTDGVLNSSAFTIEMWIKQSIITTSAFAHGKRLLDLGSGLWLWNFSPSWPDPQNVDRRLIADFGQDASGVRQYKDLISATPFSTTDFEYFVVTFDGATFRFYRNGSLWSSRTPSKINAFTKIVFGDAGWIIGDLRISNIARNDAEILAGYNSNQPLPVDEYTTYKMSMDDTLAAQAPMKITPIGDIKMTGEIIEGEGFSFDKSGGMKVNELIEGVNF